jgi:type II secretory pathway component PulF
VEGVSIGELSGNETESLERLASEYDRRAKAAMGQLCITASTAIAVATSLLVIILIIRMAMQYVAMLQSFM